MDRDMTDDYINNELPNLLLSYLPRDVFNADETALFYRAQPAKTNHIDAYRELDGSEKLKPLIIGKADKPRCLNGILQVNLRCIYKKNTNGWMTGVIFKAWLYDLDRQMRREREEANSSIHRQLFRTFTKQKRKSIR